MVVGTSVPLKKNEWLKIKEKRKVVNIRLIGLILSISFILSDLKLFEFFSVELQIKYVSGFQVSGSNCMHLSLKKYYKYYFTNEQDKWHFNL